MATKKRLRKLSLGEMPPVNLGLYTISSSGFSPVSWFIGIINNTFNHGMVMNELERLFNRELRKMYDAEHLLVSALAELCYYAESKLLKAAIWYHKHQTEKHVERLECVFRECGLLPDRLPCEGIEGIIDDAQVAVMEFLGNSALDAALILAAQKAEHYEIATYGNLCCWAKELGKTEALDLLKENLSEEKATDEKLKLAAKMLGNRKAEKHDSVKRTTEMAEFLKVATHAD